MSIGGNPTVITNGLNSLNVFDFDGSNEYLQSTLSSPQVSSGNHWAVGVFLADSVDADKDSPFGLMKQMVHLKEIMQFHQVVEVQTLGQVNLT